MSTYTSYSLKNIRDRELLLAALAKLGLQAEVHDTPVDTIGFYQGNTRKAHVIVRKDTFRKVGTMSYVDVGFLKGDDGTYTCQTDGHYPTMVKVDGAALKIEDAVQGAYTLLVKDKAISTVLTKTIPRLKAQGKLPSNATVVKRVNAAGVTQIVASWN